MISQLFSLIEDPELISLDLYLKSLMIKTKIYSITGTQRQPRHSGIHLHGQMRISPEHSKLQQDSGKERDQVV